MTRSGSIISSSNRDTCAQSLARGDETDPNDQEAAGMKTDEEALAQAIVDDDGNDAARAESRLEALQEAIEYQGTIARFR